MPSGAAEAISPKLVELAMNITGEGEPLDLSDWDFTLEDLVAMKSHLSRQRTAIDLVNKALAVYWSEVFPNEVYEDEFTKWKVGTRKGKRIIDNDAFFTWLASKNADDLSKLVSASAIKVGGMSPAERDTLLDETPTNSELSIVNNRRY